LLILIKSLIEKSKKTAIIPLQHFLILKMYYKAYSGSTFLVITLIDEDSDLDVVRRMRSPIIASGCDHVFPVLQRTSNEWVGDLSSIGSCRESV
jgi:hypothetical protein